MHAAQTGALSPSRTQTGWTRGLPHLPTALPSCCRFLTIEHTSIWQNHWRRASGCHSCETSVVQKGAPMKMMAGDRSAATAKSALICTTTSRFRACPLSYAAGGRPQTVLSTYTGFLASSVTSRGLECCSWQQRLVLQPQSVSILLQHHSAALTS